MVEPVAPRNSTCGNTIAAFELLGDAGISFKMIEFRPRRTFRPSRAAVGDVDGSTFWVELFFVETQGDGLASQHPFTIGKVTWEGHGPDVSLVLNLVQRQVGPNCLNQDVCRPPVLWFPLAPSTIRGS